MIILGIETSCDDTSIAIVKNGNEVLSNVVWNQNKTHEIYGGIVPELGARRHLQVINFVIKEALQKANLNFKDIDAVAVNNQKGLIRSLLVGVSAAKALSYSLNVPLIPVHHIEGHVYSNILDHSELSFPHVCLTVSGGHNLLILVNGHFKYEIIGNTLDDAAGEVFDKVARFLDLGFPGGPIIDKLSKEGDSKKYHFTRPMLTENNFDFSFSGIKTAVTRKVEKMNEENEEFKTEDLVSSFQESVVETLVEKTISAAKKHNVNQISVVGGVSANSRLRDLFRERLGKSGIKVYFPSLSLTTDNAAMIACLGFYKYQNHELGKLDLDVYSNQGI
jgi:N6-L-threonylcarbamoyladenine synthase